MASNIHSTGRGGAGNIGPDDNVYVAGDITREGLQGSSTSKEYSNGRGGAGNIIPATSTAASVDAVPESATRTEGAVGYDKFHTGRGGGGNVYKAGHSPPVPGTPEHKAVKEGQHDHNGKEGGIVEKVKHVIGLDHHKREKTPEVK